MRRPLFFIICQLFVTIHGIIDDDDFLDPFDPIMYDPRYDVTVFDPGSDVFVSAPSGLKRASMINSYGTSDDTLERRLSTMEKPIQSLYDMTLFNDLWISEYGNSGTYQLSVTVSIPHKYKEFPFWRSTNRHTYLTYFQGNLWIIGAWAFCPGPPWSNSTSYPLSVQECNFDSWPTISSQPWINASLGSPRVYARGVAGMSNDGGISWKIIVADPRLARFGSNIVLVNGTDGTEDAAMCLVGGTILKSYQPFTQDSDFPLSDSVLCTYDGSNWWENTPLPTPSAEHTLKSVGSSILVVGGLRPRNYSTPVILYINQDFMIDPPILISVLSQTPCSAGNPIGNACIGYKGWAAFSNPPLQRTFKDFHPRCTPLVFFLPGRGTSKYKQNTFEFTPKLYIGGGVSIYNSDDMGFTDNFKDVFYLEGDTLSVDIISNAQSLFQTDPLAGTFDTYNTTRSINQLGVWKSLEGSLPSAVNFGNLFMHEITFPNNSDPCMSNSIITSICIPGDFFQAPRPMYIIIAGQNVYNDFFRELLTDIKIMPATHLTTTEPLYVTNPSDRLQSFYGQKVSELPSFGISYNGRFNDVVSDSILISPSWNEYQPVLYFLQGGMRLLAAHFARCVFQHCSPGEEYPVTCQHTPRDATCQPCQKCTGNTSDVESFTRRECSYEISRLSRLPSVIDAVCDLCTNCSALDSDYIQSCSVMSDAICKPKTVLPPSSPPVSNDPQKGIQNWKNWLFETQPLRDGPFLGELLRQPLDIGVAIIAVLTLAFVMGLVLLAPKSKSKTFQPIINDIVVNDTVKNTLNQMSLPGKTSNFNDINFASYVVSETSSSLTKSTSIHTTAISSLCFAYVGLDFLVISIAYFLSLPRDLVTSVSIIVHFLCGFFGIYITNVYGLLFRSYHLKIASSTSTNSEQKKTDVFSKLIDILVFLVSVCSPLCICLLVFSNVDVDHHQLKRAEIISGCISIFNVFLQFTFLSVSIYSFRLSLLLWPVFLTLFFSLTVLGCSVYLLQSRMNLTSDRESLKLGSITATEYNSETVSPATTAITVTQLSSNNISIDSHDFETQSVVESIETEVDTYTAERTMGLGHIEFVSSACEEEYVTGFSDLNDKEKGDINRLIRIKKANGEGGGGRGGGRRASAPAGV